ncbi:MAG: hypothetical protein OXG24_07375 [Gammaproteobacteria bacterium]|nr:hypothetical protein [Gammaproteobacteria bacterium]
MDPLPPWFNRSLQKVLESAETERLHHALLVDTRPGWGAEKFVAAWVSALIGIEKDPRESAHPDIRWIRPEGSILKVDQMRDLIDFVSLSVQVASRKIVVVESFETANIAASNAILKSLEEPPPNTHLILITNAIDLLLPTIRSRCQRISHEFGTETECREWLVEQGLTAESVEELAAEFGYSPYSILEASEQKLASLRTRLMSTWRESEKTLQLAEGLKNEEIDLLLVRWMRIAERFAIRGTNSRIHLFWDDLIAARRAFKEVGALNKQLQLERLLIKWSDLAP